MVGLAPLRIVKDTTAVVITMGVFVTRVPVAVCAFASLVLAVVVLSAAFVVVVLVSTATIVVALRIFVVHSIWVSLLVNFDFVSNLSALFAPTKLPMGFKSVVPIDSDPATVYDCLV